MTQHATLTLPPHPLAVMKIDLLICFQVGMKSTHLSVFGAIEQ